MRLRLTIEIINLMNKSSIALIFILLNFTQATPLNGIQLHVEKTYGFLWIFKYSNYRTYDLTPDSKYVLNANQKAYDWYFWSGYQDKFAAATYALEVSSSVNAGDKTTVTAKFTDAKDTNNLLVENFSIPEQCSHSAEYSYKVTDQGWDKTTKKLLVEFLCKDKSQNEEIINKDIHAHSISAEKSKKGASQIKEMIAEEFQKKHSKVPTQEEHVSKKEQLIEEEQDDEDKQNLLKEAIENKIQEELEKGAHKTGEERILL